MTVFTGKFFKIVHLIDKTLEKSPIIGTLKVYNVKRLLNNK